MSVILRRNNKIILYCKGADNVIYDRLGSNQNDMKNRTQEHLNVSCQQIENVRTSQSNSILISTEIRWRRAPYISASRKKY